MKKFDEFIKEDLDNKETRVKVETYNKELTWYFKRLFEDEKLEESVNVHYIQAYNPNITITHVFHRFERRKFKGWKRTLNDRMKVIEIAEKFVNDFDLDYSLNANGEEFEITIKYFKKIEDPELENFIKSQAGIDKFGL